VLLPGYIKSGWGNYQKDSGNPLKPVLCCLMA